MRTGTLSLILPVMFLFAGSCSKTTEIKKPNVIFILADDMGFGDLACYNNPYTETPVIDKLASQGNRLSNCYATSPLCAPSRGAILTGRYNHRTGDIDVSSNRGIGRIALSEKTMGDYFRNAGYVTGLVGKWHSGCFNNEYLPFNRGFDLFYGYPNGWVDYYKWNLTCNGENEKHDGCHLTNVINLEAISFIESNKDDPFFLFISHLASHMPYSEAPDSLTHKYKTLIDGSYSDDVARIYAMIESMDTSLGWVLETLENLDLTRKTIIVFTSDNGGFVLGASNRYTPVAHSDATVKWGKWKLYWSGAPESMRKDLVRDGLSLDKGKIQEHWEMPIDYDLSANDNLETRSPMLFNLEEDPYEKKDLSGLYPGVADSLHILYDQWFGSVYADWERSYEEIVEYDKAYWKHRDIPDPGLLYKEFRNWERANIDSTGADPLKVFRGYWDYS